MTTSVTGPGGETVSYENDTERSLVESITDPEGNVTDYTYDSMGRLTMQEQGLSFAEYTYADDMLTEVSHTDTASAETSYSFIYGPGGLSEATEVGSRTLTENSYNEDTWTLSEVSYGNGDFARYSYDENDLLTQSWSESGDAARYYYNAKGDLCRIEVGDAVLDDGEIDSFAPKASVNYVYSLDGSLTRLIETDIDENEDDELLVYDAAFSYNENDRLTSLTETINTGSGLLTTEYDYGYDNDSQPISFEYADIEGTSTYDTYGRLTGKTVSADDTTRITSSYTYRDIDDGHTTYQVAKLTQSYGNASLTHQYTYDDNGNIVTDKRGSAYIYYEYDEKDQLVWEKSTASAAAWYFTYDLGGNITNKSKYAYSGGEVGALTYSRNYVYGDASWKDLLTSYNGQPIVYDEIGNPTTYMSWSMTWQAGRQLASMSKQGTVISFEYNESGLRTKKTVNSTETRYIWSGDKLVAELGEDASFYFRYDASGDMTGYLYVPENGDELECLFVKNLQGDVERIVTSDGTLVASYRYNAIGGTVSSSGILAAINPIRYRSYYRDSEIELYYLQSRYYDPLTGRFINADSLLDTSQGSIGLNLFAYCGNDPVNSQDDTGHLAETPYDLISLAFSYAEYQADSSDPWKMIIVVLDMADVALPGVAGLGEAARAVEMTCDSVAETVQIYKSWAFRRNLQKLTKFDGEGMDAHHVFPQKYKTEFKEIGININDPKYGTWVDSSIHRKFSYNYNQDWLNFLYAKESLPSESECLEFAKSLSKRYEFKIHF